MGYHHRFRDAWSSGLGWDGITVAVLGNNNPWGVLFGAIFFGALRAGGNSMQLNAGVPAEMVSVIQGLIVLFVAAPRIVDWLEKRGIHYAVWIKRAPIPAIGHLITTLWAIGSGIQAMILISVFSAATPFAGLLLAFAMIIGFYAFAKLLAQNPVGLVITLFAAAEWVLLVAIALALGSQGMLYSVLLTSIVGVVAPIMTLMSTRKPAPEMGGN